MYSIGQGSNLLTSGSVAMPIYDIGSLAEEQYPCEYKPPNYTQRPVPIPLGTPSRESEYKEDYVEDTQYKRAGEPSDKVILIISAVLLAVLIMCTIISFT